MNGDACAFGKKSPTSASRTPASFSRVSTLGDILPFSILLSVPRSTPANSARPVWVIPASSRIRFSSFTTRSFRLFSAYYTTIVGLPPHTRSTARTGRQLPEGYRPGPVIGTSARDASTPRCAGGINARRASLTSAIAFCPRQAPRSEKREARRAGRVAPAVTPSRGRRQSRYLWIRCRSFTVCFSS